MFDFLSRLFDASDFPARWQCGNWTAGHGWLHILSDLGVWSAYFAIPCILVYFVLRRRDVPFPTIFWLFGAFILACGTTHLMEVVIFWHPVYRLAGVIKLLTAVVSWGTVAALVPAIPKALAMRSPDELLREIAARKQAEGALQRANAELEMRVRQRTAELEQANAFLRESQRREKERADELEAILRATPTPVWIAHDPQCHRITGNPASFELLGLPEGSNVSATSPDHDANKRGFREYRGDTPIPPDELPVQRAARGELVNGAEVKFVFDDGRVRHIYGNAVPLRNPDGNVRGCVAAFADVTALKQAEGALKEADRRKDEFLATLAHELRNPLAPIRNAVELLRRAGANADLIGQSGRILERQVAQMARLVDDLLDISRITRGKIQLRKERVELAAVVQGAVEECRPLIESHAHELTVTLPPGPVQLDADPTRLGQVLANLLANAAKYTDRGGRIWLTAERQGGEVAVAVRDTGIGIATEHLPRLFEMFSQAAPALERSQGGLGIGLALVRGLVGLHGGTVEARSGGTGMGSEFTVRLPLVDRPVPPPPEPVEAEQSRSGPKHRILVVDDNRDAADSLALMLRTAGHETGTAYDGLEAVQAAAAFRPDVVLLDIGLPKMNGFEAARHIRGQPWGKGVALLALTGWGQEDDRRRALEAGFDHHLTKPVDPLALEKLLALLTPVPQR
jgi:signal transduction histidine kinase/CheY-like chemotaxis protein